jgi:hypothetical protein
VANFYEETTIRPTNFVNPTSRYANSVVAYYSEQRRLTFNTYKKVPFVPSDSDRFMVVSKGYEYRPDLVSFDMYGTTNFWWRIMEANGMKDILEFKAGANIRIPNNVLF